jgi:hypothetical protein
MKNNHALSKEESRVEKTINDKRRMQNEDGEERFCVVNGQKKYKKQKKTQRKIQADLKQKMMSQMKMKKTKTQMKMRRKQEMKKGKQHKHVVTAHAKYM